MGYGKMHTESLGVVYPKAPPPYVLLNVHSLPSICFFIEVKLEADLGTFVDPTFKQDVQSVDVAQRQPSATPSNTLSMVNPPSHLEFDVDLHEGLLARNSYVIFMLRGLLTVMQPNSRVNTFRKEELIVERDLLMTTLGSDQRVVFYQKIIVTMEITPYVPNQPRFAGSGDNITRMERAMRHIVPPTLPTRRPLDFLPAAPTPCETEGSLDDSEAAHMETPTGGTATCAISEALRRLISKRQEYRCGRHKRREFMSWS
nr:unnamed protein product [Haemonchus contortus]